MQGLPFPAVVDVRWFMCVLSFVLLFVAMPVGIYCWSQEALEDERLAKQRKAEAKQRWQEHLDETWKQ